LDEVQIAVAVEVTERRAARSGIPRQRVGDLIAKGIFSWMEFRCCVRLRPRI